MRTRLPFDLLEKQQSTVQVSASPASELDAFIRRGESMARCLESLLTRLLGGAASIYSKVKAKERAAGTATGKSKVRERKRTSSAWLHRAANSVQGRRTMQSRSDRGSAAVRSRARASESKHGDQPAVFSAGWGSVTQPAARCGTVAQRCSRSLSQCVAFLQPSAKGYSWVSKRGVRRAVEAR